MKNRIAHWDPHELAARVKEQVDLEKLIEAKIVRKISMENPELTAFEKHEALSPEHLLNERGLDYVRNNPLNMGDLTFKNNAYH